MQELFGYLQFSVLLAFVVGVVFFSAATLLVRLRGGSLYRQLKIISWARSFALVLGFATLVLLVAVGWPYFPFPVNGAR